LQPSYGTWSIAPYDNCCGFLKLMTPNLPLAKGTIPFVLVFSLIGLFSLWVAGDDFYHWYVTGYLYFPSKYGHGVYTSYGEVQGFS
jgi:hypothetical protein